MAGILYLIPNVLDPDGLNISIPSNVQEIASSLEIFIVENEKVSRRYLKKIDKDIDIDKLQFLNMGKHANPADFPSYIKFLKAGNNVGLLSDAGCPAVADPGSEIVRLAHENGIKTIPLTGPSSILLALMASGMSGQHFSFHGYLPHDNSERSSKIKSMEQCIKRSGQTQIFMDTPFRNNKLLAEIISSCSPEIRLSVSSALTGANEKTISKTISQWKKTKYDFHKIPAIIVLGK